MDTEILHRIQFAFTVTFHYIYPPMSIGLSLLLVFYEALYLKTGSLLWKGVTQFWAKVFALTFTFGVATGIPLTFSLGANWSRYSKFIGDITGSTLALEGLFAFAIEASFLGVVLFGWNRVSKTTHFLATCLVSLGAQMSAFWIVTLNSWMHTPAGYSIVQDDKGIKKAIVSDWFAMVFNPSNIPHQIHVLLGAFLTGSFLVVGISSYYLLRGKWREFSIASIKVASFVSLFAVIVQLIGADYLSKIIAQENPTKMAAFEGLFHTEEYSKIYLCGIVDTEQQKVHGIGIPGVLSLLVHNDLQTAVQGLDQAPREEWPHIQSVFQVYHLMVIMWIFMAVACLFLFRLLTTNRWQTSRGMVFFLLLSPLFPQIGNIAGWFASCMGRQPWIVHKLLKTKDAYSPRVSYEEALISLSLFIVLYLGIFLCFSFLLGKKIKDGPKELPGIIDAQGE